MKQLLAAAKAFIWVLEHGSHHMHAPPLSVHSELRSK